MSLTADAIRCECYRVLREMVSDPENQREASCPETGFTAYDINCGLCEDFAYDVIHSLGGETDRFLMLSPQDLVHVDESGYLGMDLQMDPVLMERYGASVPSDLDESTIAETLYSCLHLMIFFRDEQDTKWWFDAQTPDGINDLMVHPLVVDALDAQRLPEVRQHQKDGSCDYEYAKAAVEGHFVVRRALRRFQALRLLS